jgi:TolB-like protein
VDTPSADISLFEGFRLERRAGVLFRRDERGVFAPMAIGSRALDILGVLVERSGDLVSRAEIIEAVWPGTAVEDSNLNVQVAALRRILDQNREQGSCIHTVPGRGYRFVAPVTRAEPDARPAPRLSIVVLPFTNLNDDREQQYFADGITEDLTTDLSRLENTFVISRNTAFTYRNKTVDTRQIGRELGVRYVLEGSVRRSGNQVRINAQLIDAATDAHLWTERFDHDAGDLFALQNEMTSRLANALGVELIAVEAARPTDHPDALDYILRGRAVFWQARAPDTYREAVRRFGAKPRKNFVDDQAASPSSWKTPRMAVWMAA